MNVHGRWATRTPVQFLCTSGRGDESAGVSCAHYSAPAVLAGGDALLALGNRAPLA